MTFHLSNVLTAASSQDLLTLDEAKMFLRIPTTDTSKDAAVQFIISGVSAQMATMANRVFGYTEVDETFYEVQNHHTLYFSFWPVKFADIKSMTLNGADVLTDTSWTLEEETGTLYCGSLWNGTLDVVYSAGYNLPTEAPDDLKRAASAAVREDYYTYERGAVLSGVRMISHKQARVMYYPPGQIGASQSGTGPAGTTATWNSVMAVLNHYIRHWI